MMNAHESARVVLIPQSMVVDMWPLLEPHIRKGLTKATDLSMEQVVEGISDGSDSLWGIFLNDRPVGAFLTSTYEDEDDPSHLFLGVYALGGTGLARWGDLLGETMVDYARLLRLSSVRFMGRGAWSRVLPSYVLAGHFGTEAIFERAVN